MKRFLLWIKSLFKKPSTESSPVVDAIDPSVIQWHGVSWANVPVTMRIENASFGRSVQFNNAAPREWPVIIVKVKVQSILCVFYGIEVYEGGKMDWCKPGQREKGLENLQKGYNGLRLPRKDEDVYMCLVSVDGRMRSNIVKCKR
jgi:hypothetical protein